MEDFVSWKICIFFLVAGFAIALYFLLNMKGNSRRRASALIDFLWTATSAAGIAAALLVFGDFVWKAHETKYHATLLTGYDRLSQLDSAQLIALNCSGAKPVADAQLDLRAGIKATDTPCLAASRIAYWRQKLDEHTGDILKVCAKGDTRYTTRNFAGVSSPGMVGSCSPTGAVTPCLQARCRQEQDVVSISLDLHVMGDKVRGDAAVAGYRKAVADASKVSLRNVYIETHPFDPAPFFAFVPGWAGLFGIRLARAAAEFLDPGPAGDGVRNSSKTSALEIRASFKALWAEQKRIVREWIDSKRKKPVDSGQEPPAA
ncbi:hypothetical protein ASC95_10595 [Pelomonas sp. Root1217]|uniref:hypothetical protein n=1 Tax=Pelomonas sp. Root1217 TaxID=1736430 RepID=UPI00070BCF35|nr:hypothetical protein [Pelomonas sp. Root1217]KQV53204.1 hypothetical protein ASC95_10595 [Pelomonas sp. Root1217]